MPPSAFVLAAGLGTRLRPLTDELPKPLMPVGDRPALQHALDAIVRAGVERMAINTHHLAVELAWFARTQPRALELIHEPEILGTAGGLANAALVLGPGPVLVWNADMLAPDLDVAEVLAAHAERRALATWVVAPRELGKGTVGLDESGAIVRLRGRSFGAEARGGDFLGVQVVGEELRHRLPREGCLVGDVALPALAAGGRIATVEHEGVWHDIGDARSLIAANVAWLIRRGLASWVSPDAYVAPGVELESSVISAGARVEGEGSVVRVLALPGSTVQAPAFAAVVGRRSRANVG